MSESTETYTVRAIWEGELLFTEDLSWEGDAEELFNAKVREYLNPANTSGTSVQLIREDIVLYETYID